MSFILGDPANDQYAEDGWHPDQEIAYVLDELAEQERQDDRLSYDELTEQAAQFASRYEDDEARYHVEEATEAALRGNGAER